MGWIRGLQEYDVPQEAALILHWENHLWYI